MTKLYIGLDLSLNSSGIYISFGDQEIYAIARPLWDKDHKSSSIVTLKYDRWYDDRYEKSEYLDCQNARKLAIEIIKFLNKHIAIASENFTKSIQIYVSCEAPPTRINPKQTRSVIQLIRSNSIVNERVGAFLDMLVAQHNNIDLKDYSMISNASIKSIAGVKGRGNCKDEIVKKWKESNLIEFFDFSDKLDDCADAYFAAEWSKRKL